MNNSIKNIPELRFSEFKDEGEWDSKSIGEVFNTFSGGTPSTSEKEYYGGEIKFIRSAEINKETTELFLTEAGLKNSSAKRINKGDLLVALYGANSGDSAISKINGAINQAILCLQSDYSNEFVYYFLTLKKDWIISKFIQGGQGNLSGDIVKAIKIPFPKKTEQQKIASCLSSLDEVIAGHSQKLELLKAHKKGLMQNLFPSPSASSKNGQKVPNYRFKEFENDGEWEEKKLGELIDLLSGYAFQSQYFSEQGQKLITPKNFTKEGSATFNDGNTKYTTELPDNKYWCEEGDLLLLLTDLTSTCELLGKPVLLKKQDGDVLLNQRIIKVIPKEKISLAFLLQFFLTDAYHRRVKSTATGSTVRHSSNKIILNTKILLPPTLEEQQKIASCLSSLDSLITAQAEKIEQLKLHKKGLMQRLFPKIND